MIGLFSNKRLRGRRHAFARLSQGAPKGRPLSIALEYLTRRRWAGERAGTKLCIRLSQVVGTVSCLARHRFRTQRLRG